MAILSDHTPPQLVVKDLSMSFGGILAVNRVSFEVRPKEIYSIIGPNGAGKTTLFNCISAIYRPRRGSIRFEEREIMDLKPLHA